MNRKIVLAAALIGSQIVLPSIFVNIAHAQNEDDKAKGREAYRLGTTQYNLGRWAKAITLFEQAYSLDPDAAYLFNIAQTYRQSDDCKQAAFFYKRYLSINPEAPNRTKVEGYIQDLDETCRLRGQNNLTPPDGSKNPIVKEPNQGSSDANNIKANEPDTGTANTSDGTQVAALTGNDPDSSTTTSTDGPADPFEEDGPSLLVAYAYAGPSLMNFTYVDSNRGGDLSAPRGIITLGAGYPIKLGPVHVDAGALISLASYKWVVGEGASEVRNSVGFATLLANFGARYEIMDKLMLRGELGLGALLITGLDEEQNPFTVRTGEDAVFALFATRVAIGAEYALTDNLAVSIEPLVLQIVPAPSEQYTVKAFNSVQALFGVRYSL